jgi:hypothetical protein
VLGSAPLSTHRTLADVCAMTQPMPDRCGACDWRPGGGGGSEFGSHSCHLFRKGVNVFENLRFSFLYISNPKASLIDVPNVNLIDFIPSSGT